MVAADGTRRAYDVVASKYEERFLGELADKERDRELLDAFAVSAADPVLDIGCGPGQVGAFIRGQRHVLGVDVSVQMASLARRRLDGVVAADMRLLPFRSGSVGAVVAFYSLIHVERSGVHAVLIELGRILRPAGRLLVSVHEGDGEVHVGEFLDEPVELSATFFRLDELAALISDAGLRVVAAERRAPYPSEGPTHRLYIQAER